jgi:Holliday junction resolvasome RuvABC endonuclease subunit
MDTVIYGIDPGTQLAGYASSDGKQAGVWQLKGDLPLRLANLYHEVQQLAKRNVGCGVQFAVEQPAGFLKGMGWHVQAAYGVVLAALYDITAQPIIVIAPKEAKLALTGKGNAEKSHMISAAMAYSVEQAEIEYWSERGHTWKQSCALAATVADAYGVALAAAGKVAIS